LSTFYHEDDGVLWPNKKALDKAYPIWYPFGDSARLEQLSDGFCRHAKGILDGCIMVINAFGVLTHTPFQSEVQIPEDYHFQKLDLPLLL
jgi:hypothetical protein